MINDFRGPHRWLSNYQSSPVTLDGWIYPTVEHAYQAAKNSSEIYRKRILADPSPRAARLLGQTCVLRRDWDDAKVKVMRGLLQQKFAPGTALAAQLLATGEQELIEGNTWGDQFWGVCNGEGQNWMGRLLMEQRASLRG